MINTRPICFLDFETGSLNPNTTQPLELAAVMIDPRKLEIIPDSLFHAKIKPVDDDIAIAKELDTVQKTALAVNHITLEELQDCPSEEEVWHSFVKYIYQWNPSKNNFNAPLASGFNINNFDMKIVNRLCEWYGPWDKKREQQRLFNPMQIIDLRDITWLINENNPEIERNSFDALRAWLGLSADGSHSAQVDVMQGAELLCRLMKWIRTCAAKTDFKRG